MPGIRKERLFLRQRTVPYQLRDQFVVGQAAPLTSPRICEPGPSALTVVDTNSVISVSAGQLVVNGTTATNDKIISASSFARQCGRAFLISVPSRTTVSNNMRIGWDGNSANANTEIGIDYSSTTAIRIKASSSLIDTFTIGSNQHGFAFVMRATGGFLFVRNGGSGPYTLLWVYNTVTTAQFAKLSYISTGVAVNYALGEARVIDLGGPFLTDYALAIDRKATSAANDTIAMSSDGIVEHTLTAATGVTQDIMVRRVSDSDCWIIRCDQTNATIAIIEKVAGVETSRNSVAQTWTNGSTFRVVITLDGTTIKTYVANVGKNSYASASTSQTATGAKVDRAGTDFVSWPRTVILPSV